MITDAAYGRLSVQLLKAGLIGYPLAWLAGFSFVYCHLIAFALLFILVLKGASSKQLPLLRENISLFLLLYIISYVLSLTFAVIDAEPSRLVAGLYNLSYWLMALIIIFCVPRLIDFRDFRNICEQLYIPMMLMGLGAIFALFLWFSGYGQFFLESALAKVIGSTGIPQLDSSLHLEILRKDWIMGQAWPRTAVFNPYPNALAASCILLSAGFLIARGKFGLTEISALCLVGVAFLLSWSRSSFAILLALLFAYMFVRGSVFVRTMMIISLLILLTTISLSEFVANMYLARAASSENRLDMYLYGLSNLDGLEWLFGKGVKERVYYYKFPVGSHSTYIGTLIKGGLAGLFCLLGFVFSVLWLSVGLALKSRFKCRVANTFLAAFAFMAGWMVFEDLDSPQYVMFIYAVLIAGLLLYKRDVESPRTHQSRQTIGPEDKIQSMQSTALVGM